MNEERRAELTAEVYEAYFTQNAVVVNGRAPEPVAYRLTEGRHSTFDYRKRRWIPAHIPCFSVWAEPIVLEAGFFSARFAGGAT